MDDQENAPQSDAGQELLRWVHMQQKREEFDRSVQQDRYLEMMEIQRLAERREQHKMGIAVIEVIVLLAIAAAAVKIAWG